MNSEPEKCCVIFNPVAGKGRARRRLEAIIQTWPGTVELFPTAHVGHARQLACEAVDAGFSQIVAAGGDGTIHEVANGLLSSAMPSVSPVLHVLPIGSANDYTFSLRQQFGDAVAKPGGVSVDVGRASDEHGRQEFFVCGIGVGLNGEVTAESRRIGWLQGVALYGVAALRAVWKQPAVARMLELQVDDEALQSIPTRILSILLGRREGNFCLAPEALLDDGFFDLLHVGAMSRMEVMSLLPRVALFGPPRNHPLVQQRRVTRLRVTSPQPLIAHTDGELFCLPQHEVRQIEIELLPRRLQVQVRSALVPVNT